MTNQLFNTFKRSLAIAILLFTARMISVNATEYVFSAPPEVDNGIAEEIPTQEEDYPFIECDEKISEQSEVETETETETKDSNDKIDSHDCGEVSYEEEQEKINTRSNQKKR